MLQRFLDADFAMLWQAGIIFLPASHASVLRDNLLSLRQKMDEITQWMVLSQAQGIGVAGFWALVEHFGSPEAVLQAAPQEIRSVRGMGDRQLQGLACREEIRCHCLKQQDRFADFGVECLLYTAPAYPEWLSQISDPPPLLYVRGDTSLLECSSIAVVGSRAATSYGSRTAYHLGRGLASAGVTVTSGLALGIDAHAHSGALAAEGNTIAVLGCGVDVVYPRGNRKLFEEVLQKGLIVSEYPLGTAPEGFRFPARNRIIAGISQGVVVVEAARRSGSLITAQLAVDEGREVYGVPGQVDSYKSEGTHWLLQQGAKLVQSADDILEDLGLEAVSARTATRNGTVDGLDTDARTLLDCIESYPLSRDELLLKSGMEIFTFSENLLLLELDGLVELLPGGEVRRLG